MQHHAKVALPPIMHSNGALPLAFDVGFNNGDDTALLLLQSYRVVAVEANPVLVEAGRKRFAQAITSGRLTLLNCALANSIEAAGQRIPFFINEYKHDWSSFEKHVGCRAPKSAAGNIHHGRLDGSMKHCHQRDVVAASCASLFQQYGVPHVLKLDAEGAEWPCVQALEQFDSRPSYLAIELAVRCCNATQLDFFRSIGYEHFKWVNQATFQGVWGTTSGPVGEFSLDCMVGYKWRDATSTRLLLEKYFTPELAGRFTVGTRPEKQCNYWGDLQMKHKSMMYTHSLK